MLAPVTEAWPGEEELLDLGLESLQRWPGFAADLAAAAGREPGLRTEGTVVVATGAGDRAELDRSPRSSASWAARSTGSPAASCAGSNRRSAPTCGAGCPCPATWPSTTGRCSRPCAAACERAGVAFVARAATWRSRDGRRPGDRGPRSRRPRRSPPTCVLALRRRLLRGRCTPRWPGWSGRSRARSCGWPTAARRAAAARRTVRALVDGRPVYAVPARRRRARRRRHPVRGRVRHRRHRRRRPRPAARRGAGAAGIAEYTLVETAAGLRPGQPGQPAADRRARAGRPARRHRATAATACCWPPSPPTRSLGAAGAATRCPAGRAAHPRPCSPLQRARR